MTRFQFSLVFAGLLVFGAGPLELRADGTNTAPDFKDVYNLIREHLAGVSDAELNRTAVESLVAALRPKVIIEHDGKAATETVEQPPVSKSRIFENDIGYIRISAVVRGLPEAVENAYRQLSSTNQLKGVVLDLRYADGGDYDAAAETADLFLSRAQPLFSGENGMISSRENTNAIKLPVTTLVNGETSRAAETLAAVLRETGAGLILGDKTAGEAAIAQNFPLSNGDVLRIATSPIELANGSKLSDGVKPDISVTVSSEQGRAFYANEFLVAQRTNLLASASNAPSRSVRFNEADLVREHNAGVDLDRNPDALLRSQPAKPEVPVVSDPVLARALDLLKGLAVVRRERF